MGWAVHRGPVVCRQPAAARVLHGDASPARPGHLAQSSRAAAADGPRPHAPSQGNRQRVGRVTRGCKCRGAPGVCREDGDGAAPAGGPAGRGQWRRGPRAGRRAAARRTPGRVQAWVRAAQCTGWKRQGARGGAGGMGPRGRTHTVRGHAAARGRGLPGVAGAGRAASGGHRGCSGRAVAPRRTGAHARTQLAKVKFGLSGKGRFGQEGCLGAPGRARARARGRRAGTGTARMVLREASFGAAAAAGPQRLGAARDAAAPHHEQGLRGGGGCAAPGARAGRERGRDCSRGMLRRRGGGAGWCPRAPHRRAAPRARRGARTVRASARAIRKGWVCGGAARRGAARRGAGGAAPRRRRQRGRWAGGLGARARGVMGRGMRCGDGSQSRVGQREESLLTFGGRGGGRRAGPGAPRRRGRRAAMPPRPSGRGAGQALAGGVPQWAGGPGGGRRGAPRGGGLPRVYSPAPARRAGRRLGRLGTRRAGRCADAPVARGRRARSAAGGGRRRPRRARGGWGEGSRAAQ
jgi:hypothetical protein